MTKGQSVYVKLKNRKRRFYGRFLGCEQIASGVLCPLDTGLVAIDDHETIIEVPMSWICRDWGSGSNYKQKVKKKNVKKGR